MFVLQSVAEVLQQKIFFLTVVFGQIIFEGITPLPTPQEEGVRVSILLYKEVAAVLGINSLHSKRRMLQHPNIRCIRHPDHAPLPVMWAHHEKCVVIDQATAFLGGIDMCFGR